jgi:hypothetical protein
VSARALLIDGASPPTEGEFDSVFLLNIWADGDPKAESLPDLVDREADQLQTRIVEWLLELRNGLHNDHLASLHPIFEGNYATTPEFYQLAQLLVLSKALKDRAITELHYSGRQYFIQQCLADWCHANNVVFSGTARRPRLFLLRWSLSRWKKTLAIFVTAIRNLRRNEALPPNCRYLFVDYLVGDPLKNYWGNLASQFDEVRNNGTFVHSFTPHNEIQSTKSAEDHLNRLRTNHPGVNQLLTHHLLRMSDLLPMIRLSRRVTLDRYPNKVGAELWNLDGIRTDLLFTNTIGRGSLGSAAVDSAVKVLAFKRLLKLADAQCKVLYLAENHSWERALLIAAHAANLEIVGVAHTVIRPLDLRYRILISDLADNSTSETIRPHMIVVNGVAAEKAIKGRLPIKTFKVVEALRYRNLTQTDPVEATVSTALLAGDLVPAHTSYLLAETVPVLRRLGFEILFKPHPANSESLNTAKKLGLRISDEPFATALTRVHVVIAGSITAASAEAAHLGVPVITVVDPHFFNLSPLRGRGGETFVRSADALHHALENLNGMNSTPQEWFCLDEELPRWREILLA